MFDAKMLVYDVANCRSASRRLTLNVFALLTVDYGRLFCIKIVLAEFLRVRRK